MKHQQLRQLYGTVIAHRGWYDVKQVPENTMCSFLKAVQNQYPIELDVRLTKDKKIVVFHDSSLNRLTHISTKIEDITYQELKQIHLLDTEECIPLLTDVLNIVDGKVFLDIEIKNGSRMKELEILLIEMLDQYQGDFAITSFNPKVIYWFRKHRPNYLRGQLIKAPKSNRIIKLKEWGYMIGLKYIVKPDFIACHIHYLPNYITSTLKLPVFSWTVRNEEELKKAQKYSDVYIVENILDELCMNKQPN